MGILVKVIGETYSTATITLSYYYRSFETNVFNFGYSIAKVANTRIGDGKIEPEDPGS